MGVKRVLGLTPEAMVGYQRGFAYSIKPNATFLFGLQNAVAVLGTGSASHATSPTPSPPSPRPAPPSCAVSQPRMIAEPPALPEAMTLPQQAAATLSLQSLRASL